MSDRFHKAARDGLIEMLKEASRREVNLKDVDGMTPVLWAAFEGRIDALRLLVGKGGDPEKADKFGNTALHLCAARGHLQCVNFLIKFGINPYELDIDRHTAKDLAAINNNEDILRYLDSVSSNLELMERKKAKSFKESAEKNFEKRMKEYYKRVQKLDAEAEKIKLKAIKPSTVLTALKNKILSSSQGNLGQSQADANNKKFSVLVGGTINSKTDGLQKKIKNQVFPKNDGLTETDSSGRSVRSFKDLQKDSEILFVGSFNSNSESGKRGKIADVFTDDSANDYEKNAYAGNYSTLLRSQSQPDFFNNTPNADGSNLEGRGQLFQRPALGSLAFRRSIHSALNQLHEEAALKDACKDEHSNRDTDPRSYLTLSDTDSDGISGSEEEQGFGSPIQRFLSAWGLEEYLIIFQKQQIDLDTLMLLTEADLKSLDLPLGPFRKLVNAIQERKSALKNPGSIIDSRL